MFSTLGEQVNSSDTEHRESYLRWQKIAITQLGYTINLMMTLAVGILALFIKEKLDGQFEAFGWELRFGLGYLLLSVLIAITANVTRAIDFRYTRRAARKRMETGQDDQALRNKAECFGAWTWCLFYFQAATLALGIMLLASCLRAFVANS
jgi:hypothetical protein